MKFKYILSIIAIFFLILTVILSQLNLTSSSEFWPILFGILAIVFSLLAGFMGIIKK
ncbi:hypothetical protein TEHD23766T_1739 [Tetragenococcus halophilus subsp. flandriensis]|nr:hypothetical protein TEHD23766T_1739 [Tetragenococcus halophilus subsp. flandriensis]